MANEISWATLETDAGLAHYLMAGIHEDLYDPTDLRAVCTRRPWSDNMGSESGKVTAMAMAHTFAAASTEISGGASNEAAGTRNFQFNPTRRTMKWQVTDLWRKVAVNGSIDVDLLARLIAIGTGLTFTDMLCALFASLSVTAGSATAQMSVDFGYDAQYKLNNARAVGPFRLVLFPHCFNKWQDSLRGEAGAVQFVPATADLLSARGPGYKGAFGTTEVWDSDSVTSDGGSTYKRNAMLSDGCFEYVEAPPADIADAVAPNVVTIVDGLVRMVRTYSAETTLTTIDADYYPSVVEAEDARGVLISALAA
jgi:hypothetical protein